MAKKRLFDEHGNEVKGKLKKPFYKKVWFWFIVVIFIGLVGGGLGEDNEEADASIENKSSEKVTAEEPEEKNEKEVKSYGINEKVNVGDVLYVVNGIETATNVGGEYGQNSKGTYLIVDISVTNNGSEALTVSDSFFVLKNDDKSYESDAAAAIYANEDSSFFLDSINPELTMSGKVVFDVSDAVLDSSTKKLEVSTGYWSTETELINLQ